MLEFEPQEAVESIGPMLFGRLASLCTFLVYNAMSIEELSAHLPRHCRDEEPRRIRLFRYAQREHIRGKGPMAVIGSGVRIAGARFRCRYHGAYRKATMYRPPPFPGEAGGGWPALSTRRLSYRRILNTFLGRPRGKGCSTPALTASPADESLCSILLAVRSDTPIASRSSLAVVVSRPSPRMIP